MKGINNTRIVQDTIGAQLRKAREDNGLRRPAFVKYLNDSSKAPIESQAEMTVERLKQWEYGNNPVSLEWIPAICDVLDCDVGYLFGEYTEKKRKISDACITTGLSEQAIKNLLYLKKISQIGKLFYFCDVFCLSSFEEETPIGIIKLCLEDMELLQLLYLFFAFEGAENATGIFKHDSSNSVLIELIGKLTSKRDLFEKKTAL